VATPLFDKLVVLFIAVSVVIPVATSWKLPWTHDTLPTERILSAHGLQLVKLLLESFWETYKTSHLLAY